VVNPTNPNIVYVAALGQPWAPNAERGLYKTTDGGATWTLSKFISDRAGFVDVRWIRPILKCCSRRAGNGSAAPTT